MTQFPTLRQALAPLLEWIRKEALPFWGTVGVDHARGGFHERLDLQGRPVLEAPKRLMVQGRQLYVYCHAGRLGWHSGARELADRCVEYMLSSFYRRDGQRGWVHSLAPDGSIASSARESYAHAFALLGLAWYHRWTGDCQVLAIADETLAFLDEILASKRGGYLDAVPPPDAVRRQNPHMHLFESFMALFQATRDGKYLAKCADLLELFATRFFQPAGGSLCEYFTQNLEPLPDARGRITEPGHHYEWIWLLRHFQRASNWNVGRYCTALYEYADRYGWDAEGFVVDQIDSSGAILKPSRRCWPQAEALKANIVEGEAGRPGCDERATRCVSRLTQAFVARPLRGAWTDRVSEKGGAASDFVPASTLYHIFAAVAESVRVTSGVEHTVEPASPTSVNATSHQPR
jgi:mannose/cellobiose epimerase-like protein (N-acyl-D-glucosamine 2-epimerase family)